jgi:hypothetical protein
MVRPIGSKAHSLLVCPHHADGRVTLNGHYGGAHRRQRYRHIPGGQLASHNFSGLLAGIVLESGATCDHFEQSLAPHQGPHTASHYDFPVQEVACSLVLVGQGVIYTEAAQRCGMRWAASASDAQVVLNWVEVFTSVVAAHWTVETWPETVVVDAAPFWANLPGPRYGIAFYVMAVCGYETGERCRVLVLHPVNKENKVTWTALLRSKPGAPRLTISDEGRAVLPSIPNGWPSTTLRLCRWHLKKNLSAKLTKAGYDETHEVTRQSERALDDLGSWRRFGAAVKRDGDLELLTWIDKHDDYLRAEFGAGVLPAHYSNGTVERALQEVKSVIGSRAFCLRNARRTALMLELVRLRLNHADDELTYSHDIRAYLETGGALTKQVTIRDRKGYPSLRP